jgi:hypothetical protein
MFKNPAPIVSRSFCRTICYFERLHRKPIYMDDPLRAGLVKRIRDCHNRRERINTERWWFWNKLRHGWLKPGVWGCKTNERGHPTAEAAYASFGAPQSKRHAYRKTRPRRRLRGVGLSPYRYGAGTPGVAKRFYLNACDADAVKGNLIERKSRIWLEILTRQQHLL